MSWVDPFVIFSRFYSGLDFLTMCESLECVYKSFVISGISQFGEIYTIRVVLSVSRSSSQLKSVVFWEYGRDKKKSSSWGVRNLRTSFETWLSFFKIHQLITGGQTCFFVTEEILKNVCNLQHIFKRGHTFLLFSNKDLSFVLSFNLIIFNQKKKKNFKYQPKFPNFYKNNNRNAIHSVSLTLIFLLLVGVVVVLLSLSLFSFYLSKA